MTENECILVKNLANVNTALQAVRDMMAGFDGVIDESGRSKILYILSTWQEKSHDKINLNEEINISAKRLEILKG